MQTAYLKETTSYSQAYMVVIKSEAFLIYIGIFAEKTDKWDILRQTGSGLNKISSQISEFALCTDKDKCTIYHSTNPYVISYKKKLGNRSSQEAPYDGVKR